jgi:hypothetical protein
MSAVGSGSPLGSIGSGGTPIPTSRFAHSILDLAPFSLEQAMSGGPHPWFLGLADPGSAGHARQLPSHLSEMFLRHHRGR